MAAVYIYRQRQRQASQQRLEYRRYRRHQRDSKNPFEMSDTDFQNYFSLSKSICRKFIEIIRPHIADRVQPHGLTTEFRILCALRFYCSGHHQFDVAEDGYINASQAAVSILVRKISKTIATNLKETYVDFPEDESHRAESQQKFFEAYGVPGVIGLADITHVTIKKPLKAIEQLYFEEHLNRHTKKVLLVCDYNLKIIGLDERYGGSTHNSHVFDNSEISSILLADYERGVRNSYLIGDSSYGQHPWMLTPIRAENVQSSSDENYNLALHNSLLRWRRCIGVLRSRFKCLHAPILNYSPEIAGYIIVACVVLYNIMVQENYPLPSEEEIRANEPTDDEGKNNAEDDGTTVVGNTNFDIWSAGIDARDHIVWTYFS